MAELTAIPGIGPWTVQGALIIASGREDIVLPGDLALRKAIQVAYQLNHRSSECWPCSAASWVIAAGYANLPSDPACQLINSMDIQLGACRHARSRRAPGYFVAAAILALAGLAILFIPARKGGRACP